MFYANFVGSSSLYVNIPSISMGTHFLAYLHSVVSDAGK